MAFHKVSLFNKQCWAADKPCSVVQLQSCSRKSCDPEIWEKAFLNLAPQDDLLCIIGQY